MEEGSSLLLLLLLLLLLPHHAAEHRLEKGNLALQLRYGGE